MRTSLIPMVALMLMMPMAGCSKFIVIPTDQEIAMGRQSAPEFEQEFGGKVNNPAVQQYVAQVGLKVAKQSSRPDLPYQFALLNSDVPNAFALPGGMIYITRGLFEQMSNEAELAAVLGHEVGHVAKRHSMQQLQQSAGVEILAGLAEQALGGDKGQAAAAGARVAGYMVGLHYSRKDESEADQVGVEYMAKAGYNPWGMVQLLKMLMSLEQQEPSRLQNLFQTHPLTSKRVEDATAVVEKDYPRIPSSSTKDLYPAEFMRERNQLK